MKLDEIFNGNNALDHRDRFSGRLTPEELSLMYGKLFRNPMTKEQINDFAQMIVDDGKYLRSVESAKFILNRMHILLHGEAPQGETQSRADTMFNIPTSLIKFVVAQGDYDEEDLAHHVQKAKEELASRPVKRRREDAIRLMSDYYKQIKDTASPSVLTKLKNSRQDIIRDLMDGGDVEQTFAKYA